MFYKDKVFSKRWFLTYTSLVAGTFVLALGYAFFMTPYKIVPGGIYGISIILHYKCNFPVGLAALCFNLPLTLIGLKLLGSRFGIKTIIGFCLTAFFTDGLRWVFGNDPFQLHDEVLLASVFGGVIMGVGVGLIFKARASSGGTDVLASILAKYTKMSVSAMLILVDSCIVLLGFVAFQDWKIPFYSWITIFLMGKVIDVVLQGFSDDKIVYIVSDKSQEIADIILKKLHKGGTFLDAQGMYSKTPKKVLLTVLSHRLVPELKEYIFQIDPNAFVTIADAYEILGKGFKALHSDDL